MTPQGGWVANMVGQYAQPIGSFLGNQFGNQGLGAAIGGVASQIGRMLPFSADPYSAYQQQALQQAQLQAQQGQFGGQQTIH
jgi:hypothetical protein